MAEPYTITLVFSNAEGVTSGAGTVTRTYKCIAAVPSRAIIGEQIESLGFEIRTVRTQIREFVVVFCGFAAVPETDRWGQDHDDYEDLMDGLSNTYPHTYITNCTDPQFATYIATRDAYPVKVEPTSDCRLQPDPDHGNSQLAITFRRVAPLL